MTQIQALILGIVEGVTEFLPISSTAHLILASHFMHITDSKYVSFFEVFIQAGAILAVVVMYIKTMLANRALTQKVLVSFLPTAVVGFALYKIIKTVFFSSTGLIGISLFTVGLLFLLVEYAIRQDELHLTKSMETLTYKQAVIIGLAQSLAVVPGVSRAGIVMLSMMGMGFKRSESALYSFLLAVPTIMAASVYDLYKSRDILVASSTSLAPLMIGFVTAFAVAYVSVKWLIGYLQHHSLVPFGFYRIALAILVMLFVAR